MSDAHDPLPGAQACATLASQKCRQLTVFSSEPLEDGLGCGQLCCPRSHPFSGGPAPMTGAPHPSLAWGDCEGLL